MGDDEMRACRGCGAQSRLAAAECDRLCTECGRLRPLAHSGLPGETVKLIRLLRDDSLRFEEVTILEKGTGYLISKYATAAKSAVVADFKCSFCERVYWISINPLLAARPSELNLLTLECAHFIPERVIEALDRHCRPVVVALTGEGLSALKFPQAKRSELCERVVLEEVFEGSFRRFAGYDSRGETWTVDIDLEGRFITFDHTHVGAREAGVTSHYLREDGKYSAVVWMIPR
jgi:hypothetical protein